MRRSRRTKSQKSSQLTSPDNSTTTENMGCVCAEERSHDSFGKKSQRPPSGTRSAPPERAQQDAADPLLRTSTKDSVAMQRAERRTEKKERKFELVLATAAKKLERPLSELYRLGDVQWSEVTYTMRPAESISTHQPCFVFSRPKPKRLRSDLLEEFNYPITVLQTLDHPYFVKTKEILDSGKEVVVVTEVCSTTRLWEYMEREKDVSDNTVAKLLGEILGVLSLCHSKGFILRNLSPKTIAFGTNPNPEPIGIKLFDFTEAMQISAKSQRPMVNELKHSHFVAPEVWDGCATVKSDVWSCGVIAYCLIAQEPPFQNPVTRYPSRKVMKNGAKFTTQRWTRVSQDVKRLIEGMLRANPDIRLSVENALSDPWISDASQAFDMRKLSVALRNLSNVQRQSELKLVFARFIIDRVIRNDKLSKLAQAFQILDANSDGVVTREELVTALKATMSEEKAVAKAEKILAIVDTDHSGHLDFTEFLQAAYGENRLFSFENTVAAFNCLDRDGSGKISLEELKDALEIRNKEYEDQLWSLLMSKVDTSKDGEIDFEEFQAVVKGTVEV